MKLFIAGLLTESNTFSPFPTTLADFKRAGQDRDMIASYVKEQFDVFRRGAAARGWEVAQGLGAAAMPAGRTTASAYAEMKEEILEDLRRAMPVDVVMLVLHGAMAAVDCDDCEGDLLRAVRGIVGPDVPVGATLDPHANMSPLMTEMADVLVCYKEWPHVDVLQCAESVFQLTADAAEGKTRPGMALVDCHMLDLFHTMEEPTKSLVDHTRELEGRDGILSISIVHGFPFGDVPDAGTKVLVVADDAAAKAKVLAAELAERVFALRGKTHPAYLSLEEGLDAVAAAEQFPVVIADTADAPGAGSPGDATYILHGLISRGITDFAVCYIWDPVAYALARDAGVGAKFDLRLGGKISKASGQPLDLPVEVVRVDLDAQVDSEEFHATVGGIAVVRSGDIEIVLSDERPVAMHADYFAAHGIDPAAKRCLIVKSVNNFKAGFEHMAGTFVHIAGPGAMDTTLKTHVFKKLQRPRWPFDEPPFPNAPGA